MFHYLDGSFGYLPWSSLNLFIFLIRHGGRNLGPWMMQASSMCPILPNHSQVLFYIMRGYAITVCRDDASLLMEDEGPKLLER